MFSEMLPGGLKRLNAIIRDPAFLLTLGLAGWFEAVFTIEWSFPYCSSLEDGPASAVYGMPLPYIRWSGVSSMEYIYMPSILIVNLVILSAIGFPLVSWAVRKVAPPGQGGRRRLLSFAGVVLLLGVGAWTALLVQSGFYKISVANIAHGGYEAYSEFRPVRFTFKDLHYDCTPSTFWFKDGWRPRGEKVVGNTN
ncbi:MAG: hypothetical protein JOZ96_28025 [Acidobacteria bacterium]|nr:hypothetical protein [Acidobacteriota bacterium]